MSEDPREALFRYRDSIDNLDAILIHTLAERFKLTQAVGRLKAQHTMPPSDLAREDRQIQRLRQLASDSGLDPAFAEKFLSFVVGEVIRHHEHFAREAGTDQVGSAEADARSDDQRDHGTQQ